MIIRRVTLKNIRSYREAHVELPLGKTLFEGDIGSGKSTILMAIEFAFFGLGSESGSALLRLGSNKGEVAVTFDMDGREYEVHRTLVRRGRHVQQTEGSIAVEGVELELSASEIKERMLELLQFNEMPDPKSQSWIYRYAVYTPQEDMKRVLSLAPTDRLQILRRAFGIEDYKVAAENAGELAKEVSRSWTAFNALASEVPALKATIQRLQEEKQKFKVCEIRLSREESTKTAELDELQSRRRRLDEDEKLFAGLTREASLDQQLLVGSEESVANLKLEWEELRGRLRGADGKLEKLKGFLKPADRTMEEIEREVAELDGKQRQLMVMKTQANEKLGQYSVILQSGVCPVCEQRVEVKEFAGRRDAKAAELEHIEQEEARCGAALSELKDLLGKRRESEAAEERIKDLQEERGRLAKDLAQCEKKVEDARKERNRIGERLREAERKVGELSDVSRKLDELDSEIHNLELEVRGVRDEMVKAKSHADDRARETAEREEELREKESKGRNALLLKEHQIWVEDFFVPTLEAIERQVMAAINQDFNANFQKWFGMLVDDPEKEVRVDEDFTPLVSQQGYEQNVEFLSGGEKTSVSLAYRLALNTLVQRVSTGMKSNLLILDEPTDGFSREQLGNVREVLDDVGCPQVIIVSHDKELESFADQIFTVTKSQGESRVEVGRV